jgi:uncharacterized protein with HEPN domain
MQEKTSYNLAPIVDILKNINLLSELTESYDNSIEFYNAMDHLSFLTSLELLRNIGVASKRISNAMKEKHPEIPWNVLKSFVEVREKECTLLNRAVIFDLIKDKLPCIVGFLKVIILEELEDKQFDVVNYKRYISYALNIYMELDDAARE